MAKTKSQKQRVVNLLSTGKSVSTATIAKRAKVASPSGVICHLRNDGLSIITEKNTVKGQTVFSYRLA